MEGGLNSLASAIRIQEEIRMGIEVSGIGGLLVLILDVWAIVKVVGSRASTGTKVLWTVVILLLPILGVILWFFFGPKD